MPPKPKEVQCFRYHITFHHTDDMKTSNVTEDDFLQSQPMFHNALMSLNVKSWCYQIERGKDSGRLHYQGWFKLKEKKRKTTLAKELQEVLPIGFHLSTESCPGNWSYTYKSDTHVAGPWMDKDKTKEMEKEDRLKALERKAPDWIKELRPFQQQILDIIRGPIHDRKIYWIADEAGNAGKTQFLVELTRSEKWCTFYGYGRASDILSQVVKEGPMRTYLFNLTRAKQADLGIQDLYQALESIKDGAIRAMKYEGGLMTFAIPHVLVVSNMLPQKELMSLDRWELHRITPDYRMQRVPTYEHVPLVHPA